MIYSKFYKLGISLPMCSDNLSDPLTEGRVRKMVRIAIERTLDEGEDPVEQARMSEIHPCPISCNLYKGMPENKLVDWIMETEEMQQALGWFKGLSPDKQYEEYQTEVEIMDEEEVEMTDVYYLLLGLTQVESDWQ